MCVCVCCTSALLITVSNTSGSSSGRNRWVVIIKLAARPQTFSSLSYLSSLVAHVFFFFWSILVHSSNDGVLHSHITITPASIIIFIPVPSYFHIPNRIIDSVSWKQRWKEKLFLLVPPLSSFLSPCYPPHQETLRETTT